MTWYLVSGSESMTILTDSDILSSRSFNDIGPLIWIKQLSLQHWCKVIIVKIRWIVVLHELYDVRTLSGVPVIYKPLIAKARHRIETPADEDTKLCFVKP